MNFDPVADYQQTIMKKISIQIQPSDTVLDLGCGRGDNALLIARTAQQVIAVDIKPWKEWKRKSPSNLIFRQANAAKLQFHNAYFDIVFTKDTLHHVTDVDRVLKEIKRVTKKNGTIFIVEANRYNPIFFVHMTKMLGHEHFSRSTFKNMILKHFQTVTFKHAETRVYPIRSKFGTDLLHSFETIIEKIPIVNYFSTYNIAVIKNS